MDRQKDRETDSQIQTARYRQSDKDSQTVRRLTERHMGKQLDRQTDIEAGLLIYRQVDRQIDRRTGYIVGN